MSHNPELIQELQDAFGPAVVETSEGRDGIPVFWVPKEQAAAVLRHLKAAPGRPFAMLYDLTAYMTYIFYDGGGSARGRGSVRQPQSSAPWPHR